ncbi:hypothetical protein [Streptomyces fuscigenes]|uniref:hypothetical protein n=1 Tax=Streptomyces fuscigenes TaxID=1528880 RepID=UPI001F468C2D|nr:hypothetical protein [Streptomyces fuscigenes]MCF3960328.1 hypothetical protein [Streptomyces fuscigenes]
MTVLAGFGTFRTGGASFAGAGLLRPASPPLERLPELELRPLLPPRPITAPTGLMDTVAVGEQCFT